MLTYISPRRKQVARAEDAQYQKGLQGQIADVEQQIRALEKDNKKLKLEQKKREKETNRDFSKERLEKVKDL